jgi:hypothetical protein
LISRAAAAHNPRIGVVRSPFPKGEWRMLHRPDDLALHATAAGVMVAIAVGVALLVYAAFLLAGIVPAPTLNSLIPSLQGLLSSG